MHWKQFILMPVLLMICLWLLGPSVRADDARDAVKKSLLTLGSVHSYRFVTALHNPGSSEADVFTHGESTELPQLTHKFLTLGSDTSETVLTNDGLYVRHNHGPWKTADTQGSPPPWKDGWLHSFRPDAFYFFVRHDVLDAVPVAVYVYVLRPRDGSRIDNVIWVGTRDHLPRKLVYRFTNASGAVLSVGIVSWSDFNAPIKITVPKVAPPTPMPHNAKRIPH